MRRANLVEGLEALDLEVTDAGDLSVPKITPTAKGKLKNAAPILKSFADDKKIRVVGGIYKLKSGKVELTA